MKYKIIILKRAARYIEKQSPEMQERLLKAIYRLPAGDVEAMKKYQNLYRLRVGKARVIYSVDGDTITITVTDAGNRGQIYNRY